MYNNLQLKKIIVMHNAEYKNEIDKMDVLTKNTGNLSSSLMFSTNWI